jgi:hypothetical protein
VHFVANLRTSVIVVFLVPLSLLRIVIGELNSVTADDSTRSNSENE